MTATPADYAATFGYSKEGQAVLDDLLRTFGRPPFAPGKPDLTAYNCGAKAVVEHILGQIQKAEPPPQRKKTA